MIVLPMSDFALFCDSVLYLPAIMFSDLSNNVPQFRLVSSPLSIFFSSLLLHSLEAIHDVSFNWFFPNKLGLIVLKKIKNPINKKRAKLPRFISLKAE